MRSPRAINRGWIVATAVSAQVLTVQAGDAGRGQAFYEQRCSGCHSVDANRVGPMHRGVVGRKAGSVPGFDYSPALKGSSVVWSAAMLDRWLKNPEALIPGNRMAYSVADAGDRADIIAYLSSLSGKAVEHSPAAMPAAHSAAGTER